MDSGYYAACSGLVSRMEALDTIANNLANVSTSGFRAHENVFSSILATSGSSHLSMLNQDENDYGVLTGTHLDTSQGALIKTGNDLDLAVEGPGYIAVQTPGGPVYTRGGNLHVSPQGLLVTNSGDPVQGQDGSITILGAPVSISPDGTISTNGAITGKLRLVEFGLLTDLKNIGNNYYVAPPNTASVALASEVRQGMLEASNVNPMTSVVELVTAQREVETMRRVLTLFNSEMDKTAAQDLPHVG